MKKLTNTICVIFLIAILASCGTTQQDIDSGSSDNDRYKDASTTNIAEVTEGDFIYRLVSDHQEYQENDTVSLYAELEYIGNNQEITISHAASPFSFYITETTRDYQIDYPMNQPLLSTTLKQGEPLREEYKASGGYSENDPQEYIEFLHQLWEEGFPSGEYVIKGSADFFIETNETDTENYHIEAQINFSVTANDE